MPRSRAFEPSPIAIVGGALAIVSCFLAWEDVAGLAWNNSFKVPLEFLWDKDASGGVKLGIPLLSVAAAVVVLSLSRILQWTSCGASVVSCCSGLARCSSSSSVDASVGTT